MNAQSHVAISADGASIHYDVQGNGAIALVFVHGWCCDRHYWDRQVEHFAPHYTVVSLDVAGHGASGRDRTQWTGIAFGQDIVAVVEQLRLDQVVLIGHSMGGRWIVEAACRLPAAVIGLVSVDTWADVEQTQTPAQVAEFLAPFRADFVEATRTYVRSMFVPTSDPMFVEQIAGAMSAAPSHIGLSMLEDAQGSGRQFQEGLQQVTVPKISINARPTNREAAHRHGIEVMQMSGVGHFVMLEEPQAFNRLLNEAVQKCIHAREEQ